MIYKLSQSILKLQNVHTAAILLLRVKKIYIIVTKALNFTCICYNNAFQDNKVYKSRYVLTNLRVRHTVLILEK
jgi:hypothetical protein